MVNVGSSPRFGEEAHLADWPRIRFAATLALFAGVLGAGTILINFLAQVDFPYVPQHLPPFRSFVVSTAGALSGIALVGPLAYALFGPPPVFYPEQNKRTPRGIMVWFLLGFGFGVAFSLLMGGFFLPLALNILDVTGGMMSVTRLLSKSADLLISAPALAFVLGIRILYTGFVAGIVFGGGGWLIDWLNGSQHSATAKYGSVAISVVLSAAVVALVVVTPERFWDPFG